MVVTFPLAILLAFALAVGFITLMVKIGQLRRVLGYDVAVDIVGTVGFTLLMSGTLGGMVVAILAGVFLSIMLLFLKRLVGCERYDFRQRTWVSHPGSLNRERRKDPFGGSFHSYTRRMV